MDSAIEFLLFKTTFPGAIGKVLHSYDSVVVEGAGDFHHDAAYGTRETSRIQQRRNLLLSAVRLAQRARTPGMKIHDPVVICGSVRHKAAQGRSGFAEPSIVGMSC